MQHGRQLQDGIDSLMTEGAANLPYTIADLQVEYIYKDLGIPVGFWRSVGASQNAFITESFMDELAAAVKKDPFEFRRDLLTKAARHKGVLELAAEKGDWGKPLRRAVSEGLPSRFPTAATPPRSSKSRSKRTARCAFIGWSAPLTAAPSSIPTR